MVERWLPYMHLLGIAVVLLVWVITLERREVQLALYQPSELVPEVGEEPRPEHDRYGRNADAQSNCQSDNIARGETKVRAGAGAGAGAGTAVAVATTAAGAVFLGAGLGGHGAGGGRRAATPVASVASAASCRSCRYCSQRGHHCRCCAAR